MPPVKPNNPIPRITRAVGRKATQSLPANIQKNLTNQMIKPTITNITIRNKTKDNSRSINQQNQHTITTGNLTHIHLNDLKPTTRKKSFQSKPIMRQLNKRLQTYSKQYTPQYFTQILQYMIDKQIKNTISPNTDKIINWRKFVNYKIQIQLQVKREIKKLKYAISKNKKDFKEDISFNQQIRQPLNSYGTLQYQSQNYLTNNPDSISSQLHACSVPQRLHTVAYFPDRITEISNDDYYSTSSLHSYHSQPLLQLSQTHHSQLSNPQPLTSQQLSKQWNTKFDKFVCLIDTMYELLGQNQCINSIFPACYIFYSLMVSDTRVFQYIDLNYKMNDQTPHISPSHQSKQIYSVQSSSTPTFSQPRHPSPNQLIQYYIIVSLLISTKCHDIYPVSAVDLIQCINHELSMQKLIKIQSQVLQMFEFNSFFTDNEIKFLNMFIIVIGWTTHQKNICQFILESGLNNPKLYNYSPLYKAAVVLGFYQEKFMKTQEKFILIKNLCPGLNFYVIQQIKKQYMQILFYNHNNHFVAQKKKFYIFDKQIKSLTT